MYAIPTESIITALAVMTEARKRLAGSTVPGDFQLAERIAVAEGTLRGGLIEALPKKVDLAA